MNVFIAGLYAVILYLSCLAYLLIVGVGASWALVAAPFAISGLTIALLVADLLLSRLLRMVRWAWISAATARLWPRRRRTRIPEA